VSDKELFDQHNTIALGKAGGSGRLLTPGDIVGGTYRLKTLIGQGGMGYVFCAEHTIFEREYALKIMAPDQINQVSWLRFESEGRAIAGLDHANIVKVYNMGVDAGDSPYYVMDLLDGFSLAEEIRSGRAIDLAQVLDIIIQTASGLGYAHRKGIVHRDVKPSNIMLIQGPTGKPSVRLVDFGLAKLVKDEATLDQKVTETGDVFGTPYYMSPEQCMGLSVDGRSDIYSLGCAMYEMITGVPPFDGATPLQTVFMHANEPVPRFGEIFGDFKTEQRMNLLLGRMLAKRKEDRYQTVAQLMHDLERIIDDKAIGKQSISRPSVRKIWQDLLAGNVRQSVGDEPVETAALPNKRLITSAVVSLLAVFGVVAFTLTHYKVPRKSAVPVDSHRPVAPQASIGEDFVLPDDMADEAGKYRSQAVLHDRRVAGATEKLKNAKEISATTTAGVKIIHFPDYPIGVLSIYDKPFGPAQGERRVNAEANLGLIVNWLEDPSTLSNLFIFEKIDKGLFASLALVAVGAPVQDASGQQSDIQSAALLKILQAASQWTNLRTLRIEDFKTVYGDDRLLVCLDACPQLQSLSVPMKVFDLKQLSEHKFLKRLHYLDVDGSTHVDDLLLALTGSQAIQSLKLDRTEPSAPALLGLRTCPNLTMVSLRASQLSSDQLQALSQLPALETLALRDFRPSRKDLVILARIRTLRQVSLLETGSTAQEKLDWSKLLPCLRFTDKL
jgi:serine/threonine protein kinase